MIHCPNCGREVAEGFSFCPFCGHPLAGSENTRQERKVISVLFCDLVGSTAQAEHLDPEDVQALLSQYHACVATEIEHFGGTLEKFIGDAVVALFGVPVAHEDDPERAVRAALAVLERIRESQLHVRIAINTGEALVSAGARADLGEHLASGDVLNTASRLQNSAPVDGILVGEQTYRMTERVIEYRSHEPVVAKGKSEPVPVWEATRARSRFGVDIARTSSAPLIGRGLELELLTAALDRACREQCGQLITLVGVPGIGKSRLLAELFAVVDRLQQLVLWRQGRSLPYGEGVSFWALEEMVKAQAGILETDSEQASRKLAQAVENVLPDPAEASWVQSHLAPLIGASMGDLAGRRREEAFSAWRRFFEALAEQRPLVLAFEDLHWADDALLDFVDELVDRLSDVPVLVLATARPELLTRRPTWGGGKANATTLSLSPLSNEETAALVQALLHQRALPDEVQSNLLERAGGNPLYAEEFVRMLGEREETLELPDSVHGIIAARLDALRPEDKELLENAAVIGKVFWSGALAAVGGGERPEIEQSLRTLERRELIRREHRSSVERETEYAFRHVLVRDVAYQTMPRAVRADRHRRVAEWIQSLGRAEDHAELIAHHYAAALELARAAGLATRELLEPLISYCQTAADRAMVFGSWTVAADLYGRALEACPADDPRRPTLLARAGEARFNADGSGVELLHEATEALLAAGEPEQAAETAVFGARAEWLRGNHEAAHAFGKRASEIVEGRPASRAKALALSSRAGFHSFEGEYSVAISLAREALAVANEVGVDEVRARALNFLGASRTPIGDDGGIDDMESAVELALRTHDYQTAHAALNNLAEGHRQAGRWTEATQALERMRESTARYGTSHERRWMHAVNAVVQYVGGDWEEALRESAEVTEHLQAGATTYLESVARSVRALILLARDEVGGAEPESEDAVAAAQKAADVQVLGPALASRARVALASGRADEADTLAAKVARLDPVAALLAEAQPFVDFLLLLHELDMDQELETLLDRLPAKWPWTRLGREIICEDFVAAADILTGSGQLLWEARLRLRAGQALSAAGSGEASEQVAQALEFFRGVGATRYVRQAESLSPAAAP